MGRLREWWREAPKKSQNVIKGKTALCSRGPKKCQNVTRGEIFAVSRPEIRSKPEESGFGPRNDQNVTRGKNRTCSRKGQNVTRCKTAILQNYIRVKRRRRVVQSSGSGTGIDPVVVQVEVQKGWCSLVVLRTPSNVDLHGREVVVHSDRVAEDEEESSTVVRVSMCQGGPGARCAGVPTPKVWILIWAGPIFLKGQSQVEVPVGEVVPVRPSAVSWRARFLFDQWDLWEIVA